MDEHPAVTYVGTKDAARRMAVERGDDSGLGLTFREYRKTSTVFAARMEEPFAVETIEGLHTGKAGDYLAVGVAGELYPIDGAIFVATYEATAADPGDEYDGQEAT